MEDRFFGLNSRVRLNQLGRDHMTKAAPSYLHLYDGLGRCDHFPVQFPTSVWVQFDNGNRAKVALKFLDIVPDERTPLPERTK
jgi:hypothetical protein